MRNEIHTLTDFEMPTSLDTEALVLLEMITYPNIVIDVRKILTENMFFDVQAKKTWKTIIKKYDNHEKIDLTTVWAESDQAFFKEKILPMVHRTGTESAVIEHARVLKEIYIKRQFYLNAVKTLTMVQNGEDSNSLDNQNKRFHDDILNETKGEKITTMTDALNELADDMQKDREEKVPCYIADIDYYTYGGWAPGNLIILAARPSVGKTAIALQMAIKQSKSERDVLFFSLEMTNKELAKRALLSTGRVEPIEFYTHDADWKNVEEGIRQVGSNHFQMFDDCESCEEIVTKIATMSAQGKCDIVYIDYLGLIRLKHTRESVNQQIAEITRTLKQAAKRYGVPIVLLCQLNRSSASEGRSPQLYDLRDSGAIEQDADGVYMMERPQNMESDDDNYVDVWLRKNRGGKAGNICVHLVGDRYYTNFKGINND